MTPKWMTEFQASMDEIQTGAMELLSIASVARDYGNTRMADRLEEIARTISSETDVAEKSISEMLSGDIEVQREQVGITLKALLEGPK